MDRVEVTQMLMDPNTWGLYAMCFMQVCAEKDVEDNEILSVCNSKNPSGTSNGWNRVIREPEGDIEQNKRPVVCEDDSDRLHFMVVC